MLRKGRWKYVYFAEGHPALLFDMQSDPRELVNLADDGEYIQTVKELRDQLFQILDPEEVNQQAFADQAKMIETLGGMETILAMPSFNHTPVESAV
jgi:choline-sulfatase